MNKSYELIKLNLGCGNDLLPGFLNVDRHAVITYPPPKGVNFKMVTLSDAYPWPWPDSLADEIRAKDFVEHMRDVIHTLNECWRILKPGGMLTIIVPTTNGMGAFQDPTHLSYWNRNTFKYFEEGNPYRKEFAGRNGVTARFCIRHEETWQSTQGDGEKLLITLEAIKS